MSQRLTRNGRPPGEGERAARRGYVHQDRASARLIYAALLDQSLDWIGLADRRAGKFDDLVLGLKTEVIGHQFKKSGAPTPKGITALLLGKDSAISELAVSFIELHEQFPEHRLRLRYYDNSPPTSSDRLIPGNELSSTAAFLAEVQRNPSRPLQEWARTPWTSIMNRLLVASQLCEEDFNAFWSSLELMLGDCTASAIEPSDDPYKEAQINQISECLPALIDNDPERNRWTRIEFLAAIGWRCEATQVHSFPIHPHVQSNPTTEANIAQALAAHASGYIALIGSPGSGKSTFLQREIKPAIRRQVIRYLAFVPGLAQGQGRGESENFFDDVNHQLEAAGLTRRWVRDPTRELRQREFVHLLSKAGERFRADRTEFLIVIDGLDHIPREERPADSFLGSLPLPQAIPPGVKMILGAQHLNELGLPPQVEEQARAAGRSVEIAPLSHGAVASMADAMGLPPDVDRAEVFGASRGHPLVTRYVIGLLTSADRSDRERILTGSFGFDGDIESVYAAAWRSVGNGSEGDAARRVLTLLGWIEGEIEPQLLAQMLGESSVDTAYRRAHHLLLVNNGRWSTFHNSFRLFLRRKRIEKFGQPDPEFEERSIYRRLADLARQAQPDSPQRWLEFRYAYLGMDDARARALASRAYFVTQYVGGRPAIAVRGDICNAYRLYRDKEDGAADLVDLMLADDEIYRRAQVLEGADSLVDAFLALGDCDAAIAVLDEEQIEGKEWLVVDALLAAGLDDRARAIFEKHDSQLRMKIAGGQLFRDPAERMRQWAECAVLFLDSDQLRRRLQLFTETQQDEFDLHRAVALDIARATLRKRSDVEVDDLVVCWNVEKEHVPMLLIESSALMEKRGNGELVGTLLERAAEHGSLAAVNHSSALLAAQLAAKRGLAGLARRFLAHVPTIGLTAIDPPSRLDRAGPTARALAHASILHVRLGDPPPAVPPPKERLLKATQSHILNLAEAIGMAQRDAALPLRETERRVERAMHFVTLGLWDNDDDWATAHMMGQLLDVVTELVFSLIDHTPETRLNPAELHEALLAGGDQGFGTRTQIRRNLALQAFKRDSRAGEASRRLEAALADMNESDPRAQIEGQVEFAIAFTEIGAPERARLILASVRDQALGTWLAARKDGQYQLWVTLLENANVADPEARRARVAVAVQLVDGLMATEGYDMAGRIARQVLFEAATVDSAVAWSGARWAAGLRQIGWDGIVDAAMRGLVARNPNLIEPALQTWLYLAMPWYQEPHGSTVHADKFLIESIASAPSDRLSEFEEVIVAGINRFAQPDMRPPLLRTLREALSKRNVPASITKQSLERWVGDSLADPCDSSDWDYTTLETLADVERAAADEHACAERATSESYPSVPSWDLRRQARRIAMKSPWSTVQKFSDRHKEFLKDHRFAIAIVRMAVAHGDREYAVRQLKVIQSDDQKGWNDNIGRGTLSVHEARHILGEPDAFSAARRDFVEDMAASRFSVSTTLWSLDSVLPLLYEEVPWPALWDRLAVQIEASRDYQVGNGFTQLNDVVTDVGLLSALIAWAASLSVPALEAQAAELSVAIADARNHELFAAIIDRLLSGEDDQPRLASEILCRCVDKAGVAAMYAPRLHALANHEDIAVSAAACWLGHKWNCPVQPQRISLPTFYSLELPAGSTELSHTGLQPGSSKVLLDPLSQKGPWPHVVNAIVDIASVSSEQVHARVGQIIGRGQARTTASTTKELEAVLRALALEILYNRPEPVHVMRALRIIAGELWRADRIPSQKLHVLLHRLGAAPDSAPTPKTVPRPVDVKLPAVPSALIWDKVTEWREAVSKDVSANTPPPELVAEWSKSVVRTRRVSATSELWTAFGDSPASNNIEELLRQLPRVIWFGQVHPLYEAHEVHVSRCALFVSNSRNATLLDVLIFCPHVAETLGWSPDPRLIGLYKDAQGVEMVRTLHWVDGIEQSIEVEQRISKGQRVVFTPAGLEAFEESFTEGMPQRRAWRHVQSHERGGDAVSSTATSNWPAIPGQR